MTGSVILSEDLPIELARMFPGGVSRCEIFGKGPTYRNTPREEGVLRVCANESAIHTCGPGLIVCNDLEPLQRIHSAFSESPRDPCPILFPEYPHVHTVPRDGYDSYPCYEALRSMGFDLIPFNIKTTPKASHALPNIKSCISSVNTALEFVVTNLPSLVRIDTYGFAAKGTDHHPTFAGYDTNPKADECWLNGLRADAERILAERNSRRDLPRLELFRN